MSQLNAPSDRKPSLLWLWGFWIYVAFAFAVFVFSVYAPASAEPALRCLTGVLLIIAGPHQLQVVKYKIATRGRFANWGPNWYQIDRKTGWTSMIVGIFFIASAVVGL